jgi:ectoine hydroxylase-related dioxygenase (phytanoyl-CoA dioxygenase family)
MKQTVNGVKTAPPGFSLAQIKEFITNGFLVIEDAISNTDVLRYREALDRVAADMGSLTDRDQKIYRRSLTGEYSSSRSSSEEKFLHIEGLVGMDSVFEELIDHERHIGYVFDLFGQLTKLHISEAFIRPDSSGRNPWHVDGPRMVPFSAYAGKLPLQIRIGYWLTDLPHESMGNLVVLPGSHSQPYLAQADTDDCIAGERILTLKSGTMTIMHGSLWHRVDANPSAVTRKNIYIGYCPSWVTPAEQTVKSADWVRGLSREKRIILRHYDHPYDYSKPPIEDTPLYLDRAPDPYPWRFAYPHDLSFHRRKQPTFLERFLASQPCAEGEEAASGGQEGVIR